MAELALASAILEPVIANLGSELWKNLGLVWGFDEDLLKLKKTLEKINTVLIAANHKSITDPGIRDWLRELKAAAYDVDDLLDDFQVEALRRGSHRFVTGKVKDFFSANNQVAFRYEMTKRVKKINERLNEIEVEKNRFQFPVVEISVNTTTVSCLERETFSIVDENNECNELYGRDDDKEKILKFLLEMDNDKPLSVLPVVGLGGIGKTILIQMVLQDKRIKEAFQPPSCIPPIWVCVSQNFSTKEIASKIIECITGEKCNLSAIEPMKRKLYEIIGKKKILLVLDDVWNEDALKWEGLKSLINCGGLGSKVIITTRNDEVARITHTTNSHWLNVLEFEHCWDLFRHRAFQIGRERENSRLVQIGKEIVKKCGGLPLAAKALGSLMGSRQLVDEWLAIRDSEIWEMPQDEVKILPALQLTYEHLPSQVKQCFVYCSLFPKDYRFDKNKLIQLWTSEGFISLSSGCMHAEITGDSYFTYLRRQSFFQIEEKDKFSEVRLFSMHDLVHDLACYIAEHEFLVGRMVEDISKWRYFSLDLGACSEEMVNMDVISKAKKLRSFLAVNSSGGANIQNIEILSSLSYLRVLDLNYCTVRELPSTIGKLKHLRLLDLSYTDIRRLPNSIVSLHSLQILNLACCSELQELPQDMRKMTSLRILDISACAMDCLPPGLGSLRNLETLPFFAVGREPGCTIAELQQLDLLRGKLEVLYLNEVKDAEEARIANLKAKTSLRSLVLSWSNRSSAGPIRPVSSHENVFESLEPPPFLEELEIRWYNDSKFPSWMTGMNISTVCQNIIKLTLLGVKRCECLPPLGKLPCLKYLRIWRMYSVKKMGSEFYGDGSTFPALEHLTLESMPNLEQWCTVEAGQEMMITFPCLQKLEIWDCPVLTVEPCFPSSVTEMMIVKSNEQVLSARSLQRLSKLRKLEIAKCQASSKSNSWDGLQYLAALEELTISEAPMLVSLPASIIQHRFPALQSLRLWNMSSLISLGNDLESQDMPPLCYSGLRHLELYSCIKLTVLPEWIGCLTSLNSLSLAYCRNLTMLPRHLPSLQRLHIQGCLPLNSRCERERGEDWHKIAHVSDFQIR